MGLLRGLSLEEAILNSVSVRLRPILLTSGAAVLGAIPITLDTVFGGMAWSLIFGLIVSTLFSLFVIPVTYNVVYANKPDHGLPENIRRKLAASLPQDPSPREADRIESAYDTLDNTRRTGCAVLLSGGGANRHRTRR